MGESPEELLKQEGLSPGVRLYLEFEAQKNARYAAVEEENQKLADARLDKLDAERAQAAKARKDAEAREEEAKLKSAYCSRFLSHPLATMEDFEKIWPDIRMQLLRDHAMGPGSTIEAQARAINAASFNAGWGNQIMTEEHTRPAIEVVEEEQPGGFTGFTVIRGDE